MTIVGGEGTGSVVETHATPLRHGRSAIIEATLATSERPGFHRAIRAAGLIRPFILKSQRKLWAEDAAYAERRYALRSGAVPAAGKALSARWPSSLTNSWRQSAVRTWRSKTASTVEVVQQRSCGQANCCADRPR